MHAPNSILRIRWQDRITNLEVLEHANSTSIEAMLLCSASLVGYVIKMDSNHIPRHLLYGDLTTGKRNQYRPRKWSKGNVKEDLRWCNIHPKELEVAASERSQWRTMIRNVSVKFENDCHQKLIAAMGSSSQGHRYYCHNNGVPMPTLSPELHVQARTAESPPCSQSRLTLELSSDSKDCHHVVNLYQLCYCLR